MKTGIMGDITPLAKEEQDWYDRFTRLHRNITQLNIFECEGRLYYGDTVNAIKEFIKNNPQPADLSVWLQDNWEAVK